MSMFRDIPIYHPEPKLTKSQLAGDRPRVEHLSSGSPSWNVPRGFNNIESDHKGLCYRNAGLQLLLNIPIFVDWLHEHDRNDCHLKHLRVECLSCSLQLVAQDYWDSGYPEDVENSLDVFWQDCLKTFWGARARRKRKGLPDPEDGGWSTEFVLYLIRELQEQSVSVPSRLQTLQRIFTIHARQFAQCKKPFKDKGNVPRGHRKLCGRTSKDHWWEELDCITLSADIAKRGKKRSPVDIRTSISYLLNQRRLPAGECLTCHNDRATAAREIVDAPEVLLVYIETVITDFSLVDRKAKAGDTPPRLVLTTITASHQPLEYELIGVVAACESRRHVIALVRGPDGTFFKVDDDVVLETTLAEFDALQRHKLDKKDNWYPHMLAYRRIDNTGKATDQDIKSASPRTPPSPPITALPATASSGSRPNSAKRKRASFVMSLTSPTGFTPAPKPPGLQDGSWTPSPTKRRRSSTISSGSSNYSPPRPSPPPRAPHTINNSLPGGIDVQFVEEIGDADITTHVSLAPSELPDRPPGPLDPKIVRVQCTYQLHGKIWSGELRGTIPAVSFVSNQAWAGDDPLLIEEEDEKGEEEGEEDGDGGEAEQLLSQLQEPRSPSSSSSSSLGEEPASSIFHPVV